MLCLLSKTIKNVYVLTYDLCTSKWMDTTKYMTLVCLHICRRGVLNVEVNADWEEIKGFNEGELQI